MILMIDNYDSFTYNIVQYLLELNADVTVVRNDEITIEQIRKMAPKKIIIGPGPCTPSEAGVSLDILQELSCEIPTLGVCLGHQAIAQAFGGKVVRAKEVMHGKTSPVYHKEKGCFKGLDQGFCVTRYHSLVIEQASLPECLEVTAWTEDGNGGLDEIMGVRHRDFDIEGIQYHPESILSEHGHRQFELFITR